jgi:Right handed beta helix region
MNSVLWILAALAAPVISAAAPVSFAASAATPSPVPAPAPSQVPVPAPAPQPTSTSPPPTSACNLNATTSNFARQVAAATAGQVICLASGNYGTWIGTNKAITVTKQSGAMVTMGIDFTTGNDGFTIDGLTIPGGRIINGAKNITIKNSAFTSNLIFDSVANANILLDSNTHINVDSCATCDPAAIHLAWSSDMFSGVTVQNSLFQGGNADGIQAGTGLNILNNRFIHIKDDHGDQSLHTDPIQLINAKGAVVRGNYLYDNDDGIVAYDGVDSVTIEDNVIDLVHGRFGIELYSDKNSVVRHNTLKYATTCLYVACGQIMLGRKTADPAGVGTVIEDNIASGISVSDGSRAALIRNNMMHSGAAGGNFHGIPVHVGGTDPTNYAGFALAPGSPGKNAASDGTDIGARIAP